jgi:lipid-binding SYLF domain-containing protein
MPQWRAFHGQMEPTGNDGSGGRELRISDRRAGTAFVILVMNPRGASAILNAKVKLGADVSAVAGPKGRDAKADTNVTLRAEMLTYSRSRGLFSGMSLEGSTLRPDNNANTDVYGRHVGATANVLKSAVRVPASGQRLVSTLDKHSRRNSSDPKSLK